MGHWISAMLAIAGIIHLLSAAMTRSSGTGGLDAVLNRLFGQGAKLEVRRTLRREARTAPRGRCD